MLFSLLPAKLRRRLQSTFLLRRRHGKHTLLYESFLELVICLWSVSERHAVSDESFEVLLVFLQDGQCLRGSLAQYFEKA